MNEREICMNPRNPNSALDELTAIFSEVELQQRGLHNEALDMEDDELAKATVQDTYLKIRKIKAWLKTLSTLKEEVVRSEIFQPDATQSGSSQPQSQSGASRPETPRPKTPPASLMLVPAKPEKPVAVAAQASAGGSAKAPEGDSAGKTPSAFSLFEKTYPVRFWHEIPIKVCEVMIIKKPFVMANLDKEADLNPEARVRFSYREDEIKSNKTRLSNNLWMDTSCDADEGLKLSHGILSLCGFEPDDLSIEYK
ncbi:MAG: hypothetical protein LBT65_06715 [Synergistaceae bacterium]|jgi:hypothetical protein|nr:hypothetical protein [Synergistaceae bacterium]